MADLTSVPNVGALAIRPSSPESPSVEEQFLRLMLVPDTAIALPIEYLMEVLTIPVHEIVPIPHLPAWLMGVYNWRGEILWMVDLGHLFGLTPWYQHTLNRSTFSAIVLRIRDQSSQRQDRSQILGLVVDEVDDIMRCNPDEIKPLPASVITPEMSPFVRNCWWQPDGGILAVVDTEAIFNAMPASSGA